MSLLLVPRAFFETARISVPTVLESFLGSLKQETCSKRLSDWSRRILLQAQIQLDVSGTEAIESGQSYVIMSNHQSLYDIVVLFQALPLDLRMVAKAELFRVPIWGTAMDRAGFVKIDRSKGQEARAILAEKGRSLKEQGLSLWIAPEGTRSATGELLPFRSGGFELAIALGLPILPIRIDGTRGILNKGAFRIRQGVRVSVRIHPPLTQAPEESPEQAKQRLKAEVFSLLSRPSLPS